MPPRSSDQPLSPRATRTIARTSPSQLRASIALSPSASSVTWNARCSLSLLPSGSGNAMPRPRRSDSMRTPDLRGASVRNSVARRHCVEPLILTADGRNGLSCAATAVPVALSVEAVSPIRSNDDIERTAQPLRMQVRSGDQRVAHGQLPFSDRTGASTSRIDTVASAKRAMHLDLAIVETLDRQIQVDSSLDRTLTAQAARNARRARARAGCSSATPGPPAGRRALQP